MALASATITFDVADLLGNDFDARRIKAWTTTNADNNRLIDTAANKVRMGDGVATVGTDGTGSFSVWVPGPDGNPTSWQQTFWFDYALPGGRGREVRSFGPYTITGNADLADLEQEQAIPPTYLSQVAGALSDYVDDAQDARAGAESARTGAEAARDEAVDISGISTSDDVVEVLVKPGAAGPKTKAALSASYAPHRRASLLSRSYKASTGQMVVALYGMSITSFGVSPMKIVLAALKRLLGDVGELHEKFGVAGGNFAAYLGMEKQPWGGPFYVRGRLSPASTAQTYTFYGDTLKVWFSRETDAQPCQIDVDGVAWGTSTSGGAQAYRQLVTGAALSRGPHVVTIHPPASGFAYPEDILAYDSTRRGLIVLDYTLGGSTWHNMEVLASFGTVAGIAVTNDNGVKAHFDRPEVHLPIIGQDINDIADASIVEDLLDKAIDLVDDRGLQLGLISSMGGVFADPDQPNHAGWEAIKKAYSTRAAARSDLVSYFDWDSATRLEDARYDTYIDRYYAPGDQVHPGNIADGFEGYPIGVALFASLMGIDPPTQQTNAQVAEEDQRHPMVAPAPKPFSVATARMVAPSYKKVGSSNTLLFPIPHGLQVGDVLRPFGSAFVGGAFYYANVPLYVVELTTPFEVKVAATMGGAAIDFDDGDHPTPMYVDAQLATGPALGYGSLLYAGAAQEPTTIHAMPAGSWELDVQPLIAASGTTDRWGRYKTFNNVNVGFRAQESTVLTWTFRCASDSAFSFGAPSSGKICAPDGTPTYNAGQPADSFSIPAGSPGEPRHFAVHLRLNAGEQQGALNITGKLYRSHLSVGVVPTLGA